MLQTEHLYVALGSIKSDQHNAKKFIDWYVVTKKTHRVDGP